MTPFDLRKRIRHAIVVFFHFTLNSAFEPFGPHSFSHLFRSGGQRTSGYPYEFKWSMMNDDESIHPRSMSNAASLTAPTQPHSAGLTHKSKKMRHISSLDEIISSYSTFFIDMWGVLHNGSRPYDGVLHAISQLKSHGKQLVILSNSSKRRTHSIEMLSKLGFNPNDFEDVITSGEISHRMLAGDPTLPCKNWSVLGGIFDHRRSSVRPHGKAFVFGSGDGDEEYCTSSGWSLSPVSNANIIIARGTFTIIDGLTIIHKQGVDGEVAYCDAMDFALREAASKLLPMIVCNPDKVRPDICLSPMPGAIGDAYEAMLRKYLDIGKSKTLVKRVGKPYNEVFEVALNRIRGSQAIDDILSGCCMVGDAFETDIKGGLTVGCSTVWVVNNGIHGPSFEEMKVGDNWTQFNYENNCAKLVDEFNSSIHSEVGEWKHEIIPDFVIPSFQF